MSSSSSTASAVVNPTTFHASSSASSLPQTIDASQSQHSARPVSDMQQVNGESSTTSTPPTASDPNIDVDPSIIEALKGKDRIYVLKLGEQMESLIQDRRPKLETQPSTSYQRLLVHRCSAYYKLSPETDLTTKAIVVHLNPDSRIPSRRIFELVPAETTTQPAFKIMRRVPDKNRSKPQSQAGSVAGEDADLSDNDPISETGSLGGRSAAESIKKRMTIEEREAAYNEARNRIWMGFDENRREKEKDMSASSSSLSLASGSTNGGGGSSLGEGDDGSSPATESEWSGPSVSRDKKEGKRSMNPIPAGPGRSLRPSGLYHPNGSTSSRNSRAASPAVKYASLYEPQAQAPYDAYQHPQPPNSGYPAPYPYPYPPPNQPMHHPQYMNPYGYYPQPFPPYHSQPPPQPNADPSVPLDMYQQPPHPAPYSGPYWPHTSSPAPQQAAQPIQSHPHPPPPHQGHNHPVNPPPPPNPIPQFPPFIPPSHPYAYSVSYYPPPGQPMHPPPPPSHAPPPSLYDPSAPGAPNGPALSGPNLGNMAPINSRNIATRGTSLPSNIGVVNKPRNPGPVPVQPPRTWSYGPGVGGPGFPAGSVVSSSSSGGETVGPRFNSPRRATGGTGGMNNRASSNDDIASTTSSSTTSSASRKPPLTPSSQHPLPARPDWAVGLKPQPSLRHQDNSTRTTPPSNGNSARNGAPNRLPSQPPVSLQGTDFPPLIGSNGSAPGTERRTSVVPAGAWNTPPPLRTGILSPNGGPNNQRLEESDHGFERPPPKSAELYNPKTSRKSPQTNGLNRTSPSSSSFGERDREGRPLLSHGNDSVNHLVGQVASLSMMDEQGAINTNTNGLIITAGNPNASGSSSLKSTPTTPVVGVGVGTRETSALA
ncbi:hypothetical protein AX16_001720 [Volvariella volvacea WC 439]|nr:hypothetical protein AX16_001720 [Volvariella volvacea WC 439]